MVAQSKAVTFQSTGNWTNYVSNGTGTGINGATSTNFTLATATQTISLQPGEYHIYVSVPACVTAAPTAPTPINYCLNAVAVPLTATGTNLLWYTTATGGTGSTTAPTPSTTTIGTTTYYVSQTIGCESPRFAIVVNVTASTAAPTVTSPVNYCQNAVAVPLTATGTSLLWYTTATGGTGSTTAPTPSTAVVGSTTYYVSQTQSCGESPRAAIIVNVSAVPGAPSVTSPVTYCQNSTASALTATGTNLLWYTAATGGTGSATAPTPSTAAAGTTIFYVSQTTNNCESPRSSITVNVVASPIAPTVTSPVNYCQNAVAAPLTATGINLLWYTSATGGTGSATAPTPSTTSPGTTGYYVSQTINGCESQRAVITVNISATAGLPIVTTPVTYCQNTTATALTATGTNLLWYINATGGIGSTTAPTPSTSIAGSTTYYVSQTNSCGEGPRAAINVVVTAIPNAATGLNVTSITSNAAVLNWTRIPGLFYTIDYKTATSVTWINVANAISAGSVSISNLTSSTAYDWRVSVNCSTHPVTNYAVSQFTTSSHNSTIKKMKDGFGIKISPNPLIENAVIDFIVPTYGEVNIILLNSLGQRVGVLYTGYHFKGKHQVTLTGTFKNLSKGNYFLKLEQFGLGYYTQFIKQ